MPFSRRSVRAASTSPSGLLERALAVHHPRAGGVAELLDEACGDRRHASPPSSGRGRRLGLGCNGLRDGLARHRAPRRRGRSARGGRVGPPASSALGDASAFPAAMPSAIARTIRLHERIASSLPGIDVVGLVRVAVRVDERDDGQPEPARLAHRELLLAQVDDEDRVGLALHVGDAAEVRLELLELGEHRRCAPSAAAGRAGRPPAGGAGRAGARSGRRSCASSSAGRRASGG